MLRFDTVIFILHLIALIVLGIANLSGILFIDLIIMFAIITCPRLLCGIIGNIFGYSIKVWTVVLFIRIAILLIEVIVFIINLISLSDLDGFDFVGTVIVVIFGIISICINFYFWYVFWEYVKAGVDPKILAKVMSFHTSGPNSKKKNYVRPLKTENHNTNLKGIFITQNYFNDFNWKKLLRKEINDWLII